MGVIHYNRKCTFQKKSGIKSKHLQTVTSTLWSHFMIIQSACAFYGVLSTERSDASRPKIRLKISCDLTQANKRTMHVTPYMFLCRLN